MKTYWMKFTDGSESHCQGQSANDAVAIAEHISGKKVVGNADEYKWHADNNPSVQGIPYASHPIIWEFEHPIFGVRRKYIVP